VYRKPYRGLLSEEVDAMIALICFVLAVLASPFKSKSRLEAENAVLRHQLIVSIDTIVQPETLVRWHRAGFRRYWRWKSNSRGGRPQIEIELRALILQMSTENQLWGAPRIHGELLKRHSPQERIGPLNPEPPA